MLKIMLEKIKALFGFSKIEPEVKPIAFNIVDGRFVSDDGRELFCQSDIIVNDIEVVDDFVNCDKEVELEFTLANETGSSLVQSFKINSQTFKRLIKDGANTLAEENPFYGMMNHGNRVIYFDANKFSAFRGCPTNRIVSPKECGTEFCEEFERYFGKKHVKVFISQKNDQDGFNPDGKWETRIEDGIL